MSYYTYYNMKAVPKDPSFQPEIGLIEILNYEIEKLGYLPDGNYEDGWSSYEKWYDYEHDMIEISKQLPELVFRLSGDGEASDDFWIEYFWNGRSQLCPGRIVYDELDEDALFGP